MTFRKTLISSETPCISNTGKIFAYSSSTKAVLLKWCYAVRYVQTGRYLEILPLTYYLDQHQVYADLPQPAMLTGSMKCLFSSLTTDAENLLLNAHITTQCKLVTGVFNNRSLDAPNRDRMYSDVGIKWWIGMDFIDWCTAFYAVNMRCWQMVIKPHRAFLNLHDTVA